MRPLALPESPLVTSDRTGGPPMTTSLLVADKFDRRHDNVLATIDGLECSAEFAALNFQEGTYPDGNAQERRMFRMTRDGFMFLAMRFTGKKAAQWQERFIAAFNAYESHALSLRDTIEGMLCRVTDVLVQGQTATAARVELVEEKVEKQGVHLEQIDAKVTSFIAITNDQRREIPEPVKATHRFVLRKQGCACPLCRQPQQMVNIQFDHFYRNSMANFEHTWPLCKECHGELTSGRRSRGDVRSAFDAYHEFAKRVLPTQRSMF